MILFTSPQCGPCKIIKAYIKQHKLDVKIVDVTTFEGLECVDILGLNIRSVPALYSGGIVHVGDKAVMEGLDGLDSVGM